MGVQFERLTQAPLQSLALIMGDIAEAWRLNSLPHKPSAQHIDDWLSALQEQSMPLIPSRAGQANLAAWLEAVEGLLGSDERPILS